MQKEKSLIQIRISDLIQEMHEFVFTCKASDFVGRKLAEAGFTKAIQVNVVAEKSEGEIKVTLNTTAIADFTCDRCLAPISKTLTGSLKIYYFFGQHFEEDQSGNEENRSLESNTEFIDITEDVCEVLLLSLPMKVTCINNPDCKLYGSVETNEESLPENTSSWQESLEKLKNKYR
jgi:uncharacterized protein